MKQLLINIFAYNHHAKFEILAEDNAKAVELAILDKLGENSIKWEKNDLQFTSTGNDFYITYEEVTNGSGQHGIVREETETRV